MCFTWSIGRYVHSKKRHKHNTRGRSLPSRIVYSSQIYSFTVWTFWTVFTSRSYPYYWTKLDRPTSRIVKLLITPHSTGCLWKRYTVRASHALVICEQIGLTLVSVLTVMTTTTTTMMMMMIIIIITSPSMLCIWCPVGSRNVKSPNVGPPNFFISLLHAATPLTSVGGWSFYKDEPLPFTPWTSTSWTQWTVDPIQLLH